MKAKDTVIDELEMRVVLNKASWESPTIPLSYHTAIAKAQAEITAPIFLKAGIKEVVEWMEEVKIMELMSYNFQCILKPALNKKLKEWGIE